MKAVFVRPAAKRDLAGIWDYSLVTWGIIQADQYVDEFTVLFNKLANGTGISQSADAVKPGLRRALVGQHVVYFRENTEAVDVIRVLHQQMDAGRWV